MCVNQFIPKNDLEIIRKKLIAAMQHMHCANAWLTRHSSETDELNNIPRVISAELGRIEKILMGRG